MAFEPAQHSFITLEGVDGAGKSTQARLLARALELAGYQVVSLREPGGTAISEKIRALLLDPANTAMGDTCELLLYEAARAQLVHEVIAPALAVGKVVLCDRFYDSTTCYQAFADGLDRQMVRDANNLAVAGTHPALTLVYHITPEQAALRMAARGAADRMEAKGMAFQERVYQGFCAIAVMLEGEAVRSLTAIFLQMWDIAQEPEFEAYLKQPIPAPAGAKGFAAPYGDCPLDGERVGELVYIDLLNRARKYIHIMTPYLILDGELETALKFAAERGVDVHLILPGKPDKRIPYALAKTHYAALIRSGVKISEWVPGFVHAKVFVVDDREAVVGTINLDYRSLYHHFEDAVWMVDAPCIPAIEDDFQRTLTQCRTVEATTQSIWQGQTLLRLTGRLVKAIAPLL